MGHKRLLSTGNVVQAPFITVKMGNTILGTYQNKKGSNKIIAPNFINSLQVKKINGSVNQYTIELIYVITPGSDPNYIDKLLSSISSTRKITISYGDCEQQKDAFKNEEALITKVTQSVNVKAPKITYTIYAISAAVYLKGIVRDFTAVHKKPSTVIRELLKDNTTGLKDSFPGMFKTQNIDRFGLIPTDDKEVDIKPYTNTNVFDYIRTLVSYMVPEDDENNSFYTLQVVDTDDAPYLGPYFKIVRVGQNLPTNISIGAYDLDIGYPGENFVIDYTVGTNEQWTILYDYAGEALQDDWAYIVDDDGQVTKQRSPRITRDVNTHNTLQAENNWWRQATNYPIQATVTIQGLIRPINLVEYVNLNVIFFGRRSIYSGIYIITEELDKIGSSGITTTLKLTRVEGAPEQDAKIKVEMK